MLAILNENYPKMRTLKLLSDFDELSNFLLDILGIKSLSDNLLEHNSKLKFIYEFLIESFGFLTTEEIKEAFKMYVSKKFGHKDIFRILDSVVISDVLNNFIEFRSDSLRNYNQKKELLLQDKNDLSEIEKDKIMIDAINNKFFEFIKTKDILEPLDYIFKDLIYRKLIKMPNNENPKLYQYYINKNSEAKKQIEFELKNYHKITKKEKFEIDKHLKDLEENCSSKVEIRAKKLVLIDFFNKQIELKKEKIL